jgi:hypothetical protein
MKISKISLQTKTPNIDGGIDAQLPIFGNIWLGGYSERCNEMKYGYFGTECLKVAWMF